MNNLVSGGGWRKFREQASGKKAYAYDDVNYLVRMKVGWWFILVIWREKEVGRAWSYKGSFFASNEESKEEFFWMTKKKLPVLFVLCLFVSRCLQSPIMGSR